MTNTYTEIDLALWCYGVCNVGEFRPSNLNPGGQTPHPWLRERPKHTTVLRSSAGCEGYRSPSISKAGKRPGQKRKDSTFNIQSPTPNRCHTERQYSELNHVYDSMAVLSEISLPQEAKSKSSLTLGIKLRKHNLRKHNLFLRQLQSKYMSYSISISLELDSYFHNKSKQFVIFWHFTIENSISSH